MATKKQINQAQKAGQITQKEANLLKASVDRAAKTGSGISAGETARLNQALEQAKTSAIAKGGVTAQQLLGTAAERRQTTPSEEQVIQEVDPYTQYLQDIASQNRLDAIELLTSTFNQYGLGSLVPRITEFVQQGYAPEVVAIKLQDTPEYKTRFIGNESRRKAGLPVLSPAEYLSTESAYKKVMKDAQLPLGFYDSPDDFAKFIGGDISPTELQERVSIANLSIQNADPFFTDSLRSMYGLNTGDMLAYTLDPERAMPLITRQVKAAQFGAEAARQGIPSISTSMAETYTGQLGVTQDQARAGFEQIAMIQPEAQRLSDVFAGQVPSVGLEETVSAVFGGESSADYKKRLQRLSEMEQSLFAGQSGVGAGSLAQGRAGQF
jgi:hypothetical protein